MGGKFDTGNEVGQKLIAGGLTERWMKYVPFAPMSPSGKRIVEARKFIHNAKADELQQRRLGCAEHPKSWSFDAGAPIVIKSSSKSRCRHKKLHECVLVNVSMHVSLIHGMCNILPLS